MIKPKAGLLLLTADWFIQVGASQGSFNALPGRLDRDAAAIVDALSSFLDIINPGVLSTTTQVDSATSTFKQQDIDALIICYITWGEDRLILEAVERLSSIPILLWCYTPSSHLPDVMTMVDLFQASGVVGSVQASGPLKRLGMTYGLAFGTPRNPQTLREIVAFCKAAQTAKALKNVTIGVLPYRCDQMTGTYVDEFRLKTDIGPQLKYISTHDYKAVCEQIPDNEVRNYVTGIQSKYTFTESVTEKGIYNAARVSLGLAEVAHQYGLDAVAINDVADELHRVVGLRPCLSNKKLFERAVVSMEAEVGGAIALLMLKMLTQKTPMYTEIFSIDQAENCILIGHAGIHNAESLVEHLNDIVIEPDGEYLETEPDSAWMRFRVKGGRVTLLSIFCDVKRFKMVITTGNALSGTPKLLGSPHAYIRLDRALEDFFKQIIRSGMTQHWALVHGDCVAELVALADILDLEKLVL
jgi:L-arabinose isomerase